MNLFCGNEAASKNIDTCVHIIISLWIWCVNDLLIAKEKERKREREKERKREREKERKREREKERKR